MSSNYLQPSQKDKTSYCFFGNLGFTLTEVIISVSISVVVVAVSLIVLFSSLNSYNRGSDQARVQQNAQLQAEHVSRELRQAKKIIQITESGVNPFYTKIKFTNLLDTEVLYIYDANRKYLIRREAGVTDKIIARIFRTHDDISFTGYKQNNEATTNPSEVRAVKTDLKVTDEQNQNTFYLRTTIFLRNSK
jgi:Tfp pilus assembly protein PilV